MHFYNSVVVVGAGQAGVHAAFAARSAGHGGPVVIVDAEPAAPYSRPALSKSHLTGDATAIPLRSPAALREAGVELLRGAVARLDRAAHRVVLADGSTLAYERLVLATGALARPLPSLPHACGGVLPLRTLADADALRAGLGRVAHVVVVGGGLLGLEVASSARARGVEVTVVEAAPRLMARAVSPAVSEHLLRLHTRNGVTVRLGAGVDGVEVDGDGAVTGVRTGGELLPTRLVVVAAGIVPDTGLAGRAGLAVDDGIVVDAALVTSDPAIAAAGDCARHQGLRHETEQNAIDQGAHAGRWLATGRSVPYGAPSWCWTEQHGERVYLSGTRTDGDEAVVRGDPTGPFAVYHLRAGSVTAVEAVGSVPDHRTARRLLTRPDLNRDLTAGGLADVSRPVLAPTPVPAS